MWEARLTDLDLFSDFLVPLDERRLQLEQRQKDGIPLRAIFGGPEQSQEESDFSDALTKIAEAHQVESITAVAIACTSQSLWIDARTSSPQRARDIVRLKADRLRMTFPLTIFSRCHGKGTLCLPAHWR